MFVFVAGFSRDESDCSNHEGDAEEEGGEGDDCDPCRRFLFFNGPLALSSLMRRFRRLVGKAGRGGGEDGGRRRDDEVSGGVVEGRVCAGDGGRGHDAVDDGTAVVVAEEGAAAVGGGAWCMKGASSEV